jgi:plastocyanin
MQSKMMICGGASILGLSLILAACNNTVPPVDTGGAAVVCPATIQTTGSLTYDPPTCTAKVGQQISIEASGFHPLQGATAGGPIDSTKSSTAKVTLTFDKAGKFEFFCTNHGVGSGQMKGTITVTN